MSKTANCEEKARNGEDGSPGWLRDPSDRRPDRRSTPKDANELSDRHFAKPAPRNGGKQQSATERANGRS